MTGKHRDQAVAPFQQIAQYLDNETTDLDELICIADGGTNENGERRAYLFVSLIPNVFAPTGRPEAASARQRSDEGEREGGLPPELGWNRGNGTPYELAERMAIELMRLADKKRAGDVR